MQTVTRKSEIKEYLRLCLKAYHSEGMSSCLEEIKNKILTRKVKFPLLEYCGHELFRVIDKNEHILLCDGIEKLKTEGGNVLLGIILQNRLEEHFDESIRKATEYISKANIWYVCDIIGERVYGYSLLQEPDKTIPVIRHLSQYPINWVVRSLGAGCHYAIKKGLSKDHARALFPILLTLANNKDKEIRQGVGWAAKTTARFHPDLIEEFDLEIQDQNKVANWFRRKVDIGLKRNKLINEA